MVIQDIATRCLKRFYLTLGVVSQYNRSHGGGNLTQHDEVPNVPDAPDEAIVPVTVRILKRTYRQLNDLAKLETRPTANLIRKVLEDYVKEHHKEYRQKSKASGEVASDGS